MEHLLNTWGYLGLFAITFLSSMGIPVGSEIATAYAGVLASGAVTAPGDHHLALGVVFLVATTGDVLGSLAGYTIGYFGGRTLVDRIGRYILLSHRDLDRVEAWFARRGGVVAFVGRFVPLMRSFVSFAAGLAEMRQGLFLVATVLGCGMWNVGVSSLGYSLGSSYHHVLQRFSDAGYVVAGLAVLAIIVAMALRVRSVRAERAGDLGQTDSVTTTAASGNGARFGRAPRGAHSPAARRQAQRYEAMREPQTSD